MGIDFLMRIIAFQEGKGKGFEGAILYCIN